MLRKYVKGQLAKNIVRWLFHRCGDILALFARCNYI